MGCHVELPKAGGKLWKLFTKDLSLSYFPPHSAAWYGCVWQEEDVLLSQKNSGGAMF